MKIFVWILLVFASLQLTSAQEVYTPQKGSAERKAIIDAVRPTIESELGQKVIFQVVELRVQKNWAFLYAIPRTPSDGKINYEKSRFWRDAGVFEENVFALLKKNASEKWTLVAYAVSCTDVCYEDWAKKFKAPKAIFPRIE